MHIRLILLWLLLSLGGQAMPLQAPGALERLLELPGLRSASVGISVRRIKDGKEIVSHFPDKALVPASIAKLLPTWYALEKKGGDFVWKTDVFLLGRIVDSCLYGDLVVCAAGDVTIDSRHFPRHSLLKAIKGALKGRGIRTITGFVKVEGAGVGTDVPGSWPWEDISNYYGALYLPFNYRDNSYVLDFATGKAGTPARLVGMVPALPGVRLVNEVKASRSGKDDAWIFGGPYSNVLCVKGSIPEYRSSFMIRGAIHDPAAAFASELESLLAGEGIVVEGKKMDRVGEQTRLVQHVSPSLKEVVYMTNKLSRNLFAEALGSLAAHGDWVRNSRSLLEDSGIDADGLILRDACGLSPMNAVPPRIFTELLVYAAGRRNGGILELSLPAAGVDGGLGNYCHDHPRLKGRMKAKTGSMSGVRCLAGYLECSDGEKLAFTVMVNHYTCPAAELQRAVGRFLEALL